MTQPMPVDRISLTTLRLFVAVVEEGSLSKAAERESIATSAASRRLNDLESGLDVVLFTRNTRRREPAAACAPDVACRLGIIQ